MARNEPGVTIAGAHIEPLDGLPRRLAHDRLRFQVTCVALVLTVPALGAMFKASLMPVGRALREATLAYLIYGEFFIMLWTIVVVVLVIVLAVRYSAHCRRAAWHRAERVAQFRWFEVWADHPVAPATRPRHLRSRAFLQLFVHPDPAVPRYLTQGTDLVVTGGCTTDDLRVVTAHLDVLLHRALLLGFDDPRVPAAIRPVPKGALLVPYGRRQWEVHDPAAAHALIAADLASGWPPPSLIARYRDLLASGADAR